jgi:hypothetical protein
VFHAIQQRKEGAFMRGSVRIAMTLIGISVSMMGVSTPAWSALRIDNGAVIQADAETVARIEEVFNRAEDAIAEKNLDALMALYSEHYRDQDRTKAEMRTIWKSFFDQYDQIDTLHSFSRLIVRSGPLPTADITCTGALWATVTGTEHRVNLSLWAGDLHHLRDEDGAWRIVGQGRNGLNRSEFGTAPPPLF